VWLFQLLLMIIIIHITHVLTTLHPYMDTLDMTTGPNIMDITDTTTGPTLGIMATTGIDTAVIMGEEDIIPVAVMDTRGKQGELINSFLLSIIRWSYGNWIIQMAIST